MRFPAYPEYKDSGVAWLGEVPGHWETRKLKFTSRCMVSNVDKKSVEGDEPVKLCNYVDVYYRERIDSNVAFMEATATAGQIEKFSLRVGDVMITKDSETPDDIAVPAVVSEALDGVVCGYHLALLRPLAEQIDGGFLARALSATGVRDHFWSSATGITRFGLTVNDIGTAPIPLPPLPEQRAIAAFLDRETARIDALIAKKQRLIELLQEKRAALISHAVTQGLKPAAALKDSGIPWLGQIPAHWEGGQLKRFWNVTDCKHFTVQFLDEGLPIASIGELRENHFDLSMAKKTSVEEFAFLRQGRIPKRGNLVFCRNASVGAVGYVDTDEDFCLGQDVCLISSNRDNKYLYYQLIGQSIDEQLAALMVGATFKRINVEAIKEFWVACPPDEEQLEIVGFLDQQTSKLNALMTKCAEVIERLQEYRASLIAHAVTGKIDVRGTGLAP